MTVVLAVTVGLLYATGTYLLLQRTLTRIVFGLVLIGHGLNLLLLVTGRAGAPPMIADGPTGPVADPLPQAMALTAIVITFATSGLLLVMAYRRWTLEHHDEVQDDIEDRRIAQLDARSAAAELARDEEPEIDDGGPE